jgi:hypothetical protein
MDASDSTPTRPIDPEALGRLEEGAPPPQTGPHDLFPGDSRYLGTRARRQRLRLWRAIAPVVDAVLKPEEKVLYVASAMRRITSSQWLGLGGLSYSYNQTALVFTDARLLVVGLDAWAREPQGRVRSIRWSGVAGLKLRMGSLHVQVAGRKVDRWNVRLGGDRKILKRLLPRIQEKALPRDGGASGAAPADHCPACAAEWAENQEACPSCRVIARSKGLAAALALAFPGAGLFYAGHPLLATLDLAGEIGLFTVVATRLLVSADPATTWTMAGLGAFLFVLTKAESVHVCRLLIDRGPVENAERRDRWRRWIAPGAVLSALAIAGALVAAGRLAPAAPIIDRDLEFAADGWSSSRARSAWSAFADDPTTRSQWRHVDGWVAFVFAYALDPDESIASFRRQFVDDARASGTLAEESALEGVPGFHAVADATGGDGAPYVLIHYFLYEPEGHDVHQVMIVVDPESRGDADALLDDLVSSGNWVAAVPPAG